jgi:hypothetical protein
MLTVGATQNKHGVAMTGGINQGEGIDEYDLTF